MEGDFLVLADGCEERGGIVCGVSVDEISCEFEMRGESLLEGCVAKDGGNTKKLDVWVIGG